MHYLCPICKNSKNSKISDDGFDENGHCILNESMKKTYSNFCCNGTNLMNFDIAFNGETIAYLKFQMKYSAFLRLLENFDLK